MIARLFPFTLLVLVGCNSASTGKYSDDKAALLDLAKLDLPIHSARWETFETPENDGLVPGPTDYVSLIAELTPAVPITHSAHPTLSNIWLTPNVARPWMTPHFRSLFAQHANARFTNTQSNRCQTLQATLAKTGKPIEGLVFSDASRSVIYLRLYSALE